MSLRSLSLLLDGRLDRLGKWHAASSSQFGESSLSSTFLSFFWAATGADALVERRAAACSKMASQERGPPSELCLVCLGERGLLHSDADPSLSSSPASSLSSSLSTSLSLSHS